MTNEQKADVLWSLAHEQRELHQLEHGEWPDWLKSSLHLSTTTSLEDRRVYADWCLHAALNALLPTLPKEVQASVQACKALREHIWSTEYLYAYYEAQKEASPSCLPASDSL